MGLENLNRQLEDSMLHDVGEDDEDASQQDQMRLAPVACSDQREEHPDASLLDDLITASKRELGGELQ